MSLALQQTALASPRPSDASSGPGPQKTIKLARSQHLVSAASQGKDDWAPRPPNAWILYRSDKSQELKRRASNNQHGEKPAMSSRQRQAEMSREISVMWKNEPQNVKDKYARKAEEERALHRQRYPNYKYRPKRRAHENSRSMYALRRHCTPGSFQLPSRAEPKTSVHVHYDLRGVPAQAPQRSAPATTLQFTARRESAPTHYIPSMLNATTPAFTAHSPQSGPGPLQQVPAMQIRRSASVAPLAKFSTSLHQPMPRFASVSTPAPTAPNFNSAVSVTTTHPLASPASLQSPLHTRSHAAFPDPYSSPFSINTPESPPSAFHNTATHTATGPNDAGFFSPVPPLGLDLGTDKYASKSLNSVLLFQPTSGVSLPPAGEPAAGAYNVEAEAYHRPMGATSLGPLPYITTPAESPTSTFSVGASTPADGTFSSPFSMSQPMSASTSTSTSAPDLVLPDGSMDDLVSPSFSPPASILFNSPFTTSLSQEPWASGPFSQAHTFDRAQNHGYGHDVHDEHSPLSGESTQPQLHPAPLLSSPSPGLVTYTAENQSVGVDELHLFTSTHVTPSSSSMTHSASSS